MKFDYSSFKSEGINRNRDLVGTVQGTFQGQEITCRAYQASNSDLVIAGFMGKNKAYNRLWVATVWLEKDNQLRFYFGFESKPKRNGASDLVYDPDGYFEQAPKHLFNVDPSSIEENAYCHRCGKDVVLVHGECSDCELYFAKKYGY
ncbi:hypothetical protein I5730_14860 [Acinetobacter nosocomialis]|uniref:hypothetical protein n=1 Tax=Acinetobacter TaxID=469 RepID=UPI001902A1CE|nr:MULTISPECIES: hypothetical protein [Acinetobacter]MBJ9961821.1 hypothetical protein [Acinetobacter nosocomialis]MCO8114636.1 hypothetical protein [Acinetobacter lwoffii]